VPALIASTKRGDLYVLDRPRRHAARAGAGAAVPQGAADGDHTSPTQPFSALSYKPAQARGATTCGALAHRPDGVPHRLQGPALRGIFTPPSEQGSIVYPGNYGVFDWGGVGDRSGAPGARRQPQLHGFVSRLHRRDTIECKGGSGTEQGLQPMTGTPFAVDLHPCCRRSASRARRRRGAT
jgi:quinoprotein glucose dehydrogenase